MIGQLPPALATYYASFDAGNMAQTSACFTSTATYALPTSFEAESAERRVVIGPDIAGYFEGRGAPGHCHDVFFSACDGQVCLVEGYGRNRESCNIVATYAAMARLAPDGRIDAYLAWGTRCELGNATATGVPAAAADARSTLTRYMDLLDGGDFDGAARCFAGDGRFSRPRLATGEPDRLLFEGRPAISGEL